MKSYKLNKTLENSTYPIEQQLKNLNKTTQSSILKACLSITTVIFSGIATSLIVENRLFESEVSRFINLLKGKSISFSNEQLLFFIISCIYIICIFFNLSVYFLRRYKEKPKNMKKTTYGRKELSENFHKSVINDIVVGLSFVDKAEEPIQQGKGAKNETREQEVRKMYLYEAIYYFSQASNQIEYMKIFDDEEEKCNDKLIEEIGRKTLLTTLIVFKDGVKDVMDKFSQLEEICSSSNFVKEKEGEYMVLKEIEDKLQIHINLLKHTGGE